MPRESNNHFFYNAIAGDPRFMTVADRAELAIRDTLYDPDRDGDWLSGRVTAEPGQNNMPSQPVENLHLRRVRLASSELPDQPLPKVPRYASLERNVTTEDTRRADEPGAQITQITQSAHIPKVDSVRESSPEEAQPGPAKATRGHGGGRGRRGGRGRGSHQQKQK